MRVADETLIDDPNDEDIVGETKIDEFDTYFNRESTPKILCTTNRRPSGVSKNLKNFYVLFIYSLIYYYSPSFNS